MASAIILNKNKRRLLLHEFHVTVALLNGEKYFDDVDENTHNDDDFYSENDDVFIRYLLLTMTLFLNI